MTIDAAGYMALTGRPGVVSPDDPIDTIAEVARAYDIQWLLLERDGVVEALEPVLDGGPRPKWIGPPVFSRPNAKLLKHEYIEKSEAFFAKYGKITVVLARFVPVVRTVATVMAGASRMNLKIYMLYSAIGGVLWITSVTVAGYYLGQIDFIRENLDYIVIAAVVIVICASAFPAIAHWMHSRRQARRASEDAATDVAGETAAE
jgi:hypothetical protein